jgi:hypothetical protein
MYSPPVRHAELCSALCMLSSRSHLSEERMESPSFVTGPPFPR